MDDRSPDRTLTVHDLDQAIESIRNEMAADRRSSDQRFQAQERALEVAITSRDKLASVFLTALLAILAMAVALIAALITRGH
jgi:hypothetical protein